MSDQGWTAAHGVRTIGAWQRAPRYRQRPSAHRPRLAAVHALARTLEAKDPYTWGHSGRVSDYSVRIAQRLGLGPRWCAVVALGAELHDIGKIGVPLEILQRPGPLTPLEHRRVMEHTVIGERMLRPLLPGHSEVLAVVRWHHERFDGQGLPDGLAGARIPLGARIVAVADAFDAMTSVRPYRAPRSLDAALGELDASAGTQLDPRCVEAFLEEALACRAQRRHVQAGSRNLLTSSAA